MAPKAPVLKSCPFWAIISNRNPDITEACYGEKCQLWDTDRNDCGLKQDSRVPGLLVQVLQGLTTLPSEIDTSVENAVGNLIEAGLHN